MEDLRAKNQNCKFITWHDRRAGCGSSVRWKTQIYIFHIWSDYNNDHDEDEDDDDDDVVVSFGNEKWMKFKFVEHPLRWRSVVIIINDDDEVAVCKLL